MRGVSRVQAWLAALSMSAVAVMAGCGDDDSEGLLPPLEETVSGSATSSSSSSSSSTTTTASTTTTTEPVPTPEDGEAFDAYIADRIEKMFDLVARATLGPSADPESDYPGFAELATGRQLDQIYTSVKQFASDGKRVQEPPEPAVGTSTDDEFRVSPVISVAGNELTVDVCTVDDEDVVDVETGEVLISGVLTIQMRVTLEYVDNTWKVASSEVTDKYRGVGACYFASDVAYPY